MSQKSYMIFIFACIVIFALTLLFKFSHVPKGTENFKEVEVSKKFDVSEQPLNIGRVEFKFCNLSLRELEIYCEWNPKDKDLEYIVTVPPQACMYVSPKDVHAFHPGIVLFSKFKGDGDDVYAYAPYQLKYMDHSVYFGEVSTDFVRTKEIQSDRNEILSLYIENRSLKPYHIYYRGDYLGRLEAYYPSKHKVAYSMLTRNSEKHFQLGTWLEFQMEGDDRKQAIQLKDKFTSDVYIGDVVGRTEDGA